MANATVTRSRVLACAAVLGASPAGADTAAPDNWLGTWAGTWPDGSAYTELRVTRIEPSGAVIGAVCDRPAGRPRFIVDIGPEGHIEARLEADTIRWERPVRKAPPSRWQYTLEPDGTAQVQVTGPDARPGTARMIRGKAPCLNRWIAPGEATIPPAPAADSGLESRPQASPMARHVGRGVDRRTRSNGTPDRPNRQTRCRARVQLPILARQSEADLRHRAERGLPGEAPRQHDAVPDPATGRHPKPLAVALDRRWIAHELSRAEQPTGGLRAHPVPVAVPRPVAPGATRRVTSQGHGRGL